jgi:hypothetical protein
MEVTLQLLNVYEPQNQSKLAIGVRVIEKEGRKRRNLSEINTRTVLRIGRLIEDCYK